MSAASDLFPGVEIGSPALEAIEQVFRKVVREEKARASSPLIFEDEMMLMTGHKTPRALEAWRQRVRLPLVPGHTGAANREQFMKVLGTEARNATRTIKRKRPKARRSSE